MKQEIGSGGDQGEREQGDSPLLEKEDERGRERGEDERPAGAPHADLLSSAICTLPPRHRTHGRACCVTSHGARIEA